VCHLKTGAEFVAVVHGWVALPASGAPRQSMSWGEGGRQRNSLRHAECLSYALTQMRKLAIALSRSVIM